MFDFWAVGVAGCSSRTAVQNLDVSPYAAQNSGLIFCFKPPTTMTYDGDEDPGH